VYGCETSSLTLREEHRLRVFENRVLRRIFGPKKSEVTGDPRNLHNEELNNFYSPSTMKDWVLWPLLFFNLLLFHLSLIQRSPDSSVGIATGYGLRAARFGFDYLRCKIFLFSTASRPALEPT
jgi:hypothetical protein